MDKESFDGFKKAIKPVVKEEFHSMKIHKFKLLGFTIYIALCVSSLIINPILTILLFLVGLFSVIPIYDFLYEHFYKSDYKKMTKNSFFNTFFKKENAGEYATWCVLNQQEGYKKILVNTYLPKTDGTTSEIDLIMIHPHGIYVFESKSYGGWIFGDENDSFWTQMFNRKRKYKVINPITQNRNHIYNLENFLHTGNPDVYHSYIVFSLRCELKKVVVHSKNTFVLKRNLLNEALKEDYLQTKEIFSKEQIDEIYHLLEPYVSIDNNIKSEHIKNLSNIK